MRLAMSIDLDRCVGCQACVSACKEQWDSGPGAARDWVRTFESGTRGKDLAVSFYPGLCMQCEDHPCTADCPSGATYVDARTGVVLVDAQLPQPMQTWASTRTTPVFTSTYVAPVGQSAVQGWSSHCMHSPG